jgi:hypothetical protein
MISNLHRSNYYYGNIAGFEDIQNAFREVSESINQSNTVWKKMTPMRGIANKIDK